MTQHARPVFDPDNDHADEARADEHAFGGAGLERRPRQEVTRCEVAVNSIFVGDDAAECCHDTHVDAELIERFGLVYPITVNKEMNLLSGDRWLAAVKKLGWPTVEVSIVEAG
jgi:hypothetical protein